MLFRSMGTSKATGEPDIDRLMAYKDGKWTDLSYAANNPKYLNPVTEAPKEIGSDPLDPSKVWGVGNRSGLHRIDLSDYSNFLQFGSTQYSSYKNSYPGYFTLFSPQKDWNIIINFTNVDFDNAGRMWFARQWMNGTDASGNWFDFDADKIPATYTPLYHLTAEERASIANIGADQSKVPDFISRALKMPRTKLHANPKLRALRAERNSNFIAVSHSFTPDSDMCSFIYDHNGTPEDPTDDRYAYLKDLEDANGDKPSYVYEHGLYEDPLSGELWILTFAGPVIVDPEKILSGDKTCRRLDIMMQDGEEAGADMMETLYVMNVDHDRLGRKWLATTSGLYCISPDTKSLLGRYTVSNSRIPSDNIFNVACSPDGAVFVMTDKGLAEFRPDDSLVAVAPGSHLSVWPSSVTPDFRWYVSISGAEEGSEYVVSDTAGNEVAAIGRPQGGMLQWNLKDASGSKVAAARYVIHRRGVEERNIITVIPE